jgi:hypothetical protein
VLKWQVWLRLFDDNFLAQSVEAVNERRKLAFLRSYLEAKNFRICTDICPELDLLYNDTIAQLEQQFAFSLLCILARAQLNRRVQQLGEDAAQFATELCILALKCGYPD